jgi:hypothetical protein
VSLQAGDGHPIQEVHHQQPAGDHAGHAARHLNAVVQLLRAGWWWPRGVLWRWCGGRMSVKADAQGSRMQCAVLQMWWVQWGLDGVIALGFGVG